MTFTVLSWFEQDEHDWLADFLLPDTSTRQATSLMQGASSHWSRRSGRAFYLPPSWPEPEIVQLRTIFRFPERFEIEVPDEIVADLIRDIPEYRR
jgi:hypothetical protein